MRNPIVADWEKDPQYQALSQDEKAMALSNLFKTQAGGETSNLDPVTRNTVESDFVRQNMPGEALPSPNVAFSPDATTVDRANQLGEYFEKNALPEYHSLPEQQRRAIRTRFIEDNYGMLDAGAHARQQLGQAPKKEEEASGMFGALVSGTRRTLSGVQTAANVVTGDDEDVHRLSKEAQEIPSTPQQQAFHEAVQSRIEEHGDDSIWQGIKNIASATWDQPRGAMHEIAAQLPNSAVVMGSMYAGSKIGAKLGLIAGPKGSAIGAITGGIFGLIAGNIGIETGFIAQEQAGKGEYDRGDVLQKGATKGGVISGVDIATMGLNVVMFKAARNAVARTLTKAGVDPLDDAAVMAAIKAKPDLAVAVKKAGGAAALKFAPEGVRGAMVKTAGMGLEMFGEGAGEYLGATAAGMDASFTEAVMEAMMSIPQSVGEVAISKAVAAGKHVMGKPEDAGKKQVLDAAGVGADPKWQKAAEILDSGKFPAPGTPEPTTGVTEPPPEGGPPMPPSPGAPQAPQGPTPEQVQADKQFIIDRITELQSRLENQNELLNKEAPGSERREKILKSARANQEEIETLSAELMNLEGGVDAQAPSPDLQKGSDAYTHPWPTPEERAWEVAKRSEAGREAYREKYGMYGEYVPGETPADVADATETPSGEGKARWQPEAGDQIVSGEAVAAGLSPTEEDLAQLRGLEGDPFGTPQGGTRTAPSRTVPSGTGLEPQVAGQELTTGATKEQAPTPTMPDQKAGRVPTVFKYPSGKYGYAGNVDGAVAYVKKDGQTPTDEEIAEIAQAQSPGMVMKALGIVDRSFDTEQEAIDFAMSMGTKTQLPIKEGTPDVLQQTQAQTQGGQQATQTQTQAQGEQAGAGLLSEPDDLPDIIKGKLPEEKERLGVSKHVEEASKPLTINAEKSNDRNLVADEYHSDIAPTVEAWMNQMTELKKAIGVASGMINAGGRAARHPSASSSGILKNWTMLKRMENTFKQWQERFPGGQKEYAERQKAVQGLNVGDQVVTPYGEKGKIVKKNRVTWNIETTKTGQVKAFSPATLAPVEGAAAAPATPDVNELTPDVNELTRKIDEHTVEFGQSWDTMDKKKRLTHIRKAGFSAPDGKVTAEGHQLSEKPWAKIPTDYKIRISGKEPTSEIAQMTIDKSELGQRGKEQYSGGSAKKDHKLRDDFPPTDKRARLNNARNYLKAVSEVLGWEPAVISKKVKNGIYINEAGMGGEATGIFWKPGSEYGIYISVLIDSTINSPKKSENGTIILVRATTKKDKYGGLGNNFVSYETTAEELARMAKSLVDSNEARAAVEQKAKGEARADKDAVPEFVRKDWMSTEDSVKARMLQKELENKGAGTIELGSERNVDFKIVQHDDGKQYGFQVVDQGKREEIFAEKGTGWTQNQAVVKAMETAERELRGVSDDVFRMAYTPRPGWRTDQQSAVEYALNLLPGKQKGQVKNWTLEKAIAEIDAYNLPLERQFRSALEHVGVSDKSDATAKIYKLRNTLGWGDTKFDNFIKYARLEGFIELVKGDASALTNAQVEGSFADETNDVFTEVRLADRPQKQAAATPEKVEFDSLYVDYEGVVRQGKTPGERVELENDEGLTFVVHEDQQNKKKWAVSNVEYGVTVSMHELSKEDAISAADSSILNRESISEYLQKKKLHFENIMKEQAEEAKSTAPAKETGPDLTVSGQRRNLPGVEDELWYTVHKSQDGFTVKIGKHGNESAIPVFGSGDTAEAAYKRAVGVLKKDIREKIEQAAEAKPKQKFKIGDYVTPAPGSGLSGKNAGKIRHIQSDGSIATEGTGNMHFSEKDWVLSAPPTHAQTEPPPRPADYGEGNKVFTKERAEKARELLKKKLNQVGGGIDPEILLAGIEIAGYHVEAGARSFIDFTKAMVSDFGESIRPYLKTFYNAVRDYPDFNSEDMDSYASVDQQIEKEKAHGKEGSGLSDRGDTQGREPTETTGQERSATEQGGDTGTDKDVSTAQPAGGEELQGPGLSPGADTMGGQQSPGADQRGGAGDRTDTMVSTPPISDIGRDRPSVGGLNYILRGKPPITLTKGERNRINTQVKELLDRGGPFTEAEKDILRQYTGEGGLSSGTKEALNQHYTDYPTIQAIYKAIEAAGFKFKRILEPAGGSGNFVGLYPHAEWTTIDIDETNHRVMQALYPDAKHYHQSFENFTSTGYDLIISNVPFLEMRGVEGKAVRSDIKNLHDFYFIHALDRVKDNGVIAFITSRGTMDKLDNKIRAEVVSKADVIGAYRLPSGHFEKNSHTSVVTDIIFLQKRPEGMQALPEQQKVNDSFVNSSETSDGIVLNEFYHNRMGNLLGEVSIGTDKARFGKPTYAISQPADLGRIEVLYAPYRKEPGKTPAHPPKTPKEETEKKIDYSDVPRDSQEFGRWAAKNGVYVKEVIGTGFEKENVIVDVDSGRVQIVDKVISFTDVRGEGRIYKDVTGPLAWKLASLQTIANGIAKFQSTGDNVVQQEAMDYIANYKKSFETHPLKDKALKKLLKDVNEESYFAELSTLFGEDFSIPESLTTKTRYTGSGKAEITKDSPLRVRAFANENAQGIIHIKKAKFLDTQDGIKLLDMGYSLLEYKGDGLVFQNDILYYSGNIYKKIESAKRMLDEAQGYGADELIPKLEEQIAKLEEIKPEPKAIDDINFKGNESWAMPILAKAGVHITREIDKKGNERYYFSGGGRSINHTLYEKWLNNHVLDNKDEDESPFYYYQRIKQLELGILDINRRILERIKMEPEIVREFEEAYNGRYRNYVKPQYDKSQYLIQDVLDEVAQNSPIKLRPNQIEWVIQAVYEGIGINAHDVGGGKTFAAIVLARVLKRRGVAQKPLFVVPAKTIHKWARDIKTLFPDAKVVNLGKLSKEKRTQALGALTNQNADYILVSMEGFGNIDLPRQDEARYVRQLVSENIDDPGASGREAGKLEEKIAALEHSVLASERDERITLDKLGIDMIMADEAHAYKNIGIRPKLQRYGLGSALELKVKQGEYKIAVVDDGGGIGIFHPVTGERMNPDVTYTNGLDAKEAANRLPSIPDKVTLGSNRAYDFRFKASFIAERNNYKNIFLLTATPTPNKPMEIYTMLRHLSPRVFDEYGINSDVDFSRAFFDLGVSMDDASNRTKQVLRAIKNAQELRGVLNRFVDKRTMQDLNIEGVPEQAPRKHVLQPPPEYNTIATDLRVRQANLVPKNARTDDDDLLISIYGQGRAAAIDPRLYRDGWAFHERNYEEGQTPEYIDYRTFDPGNDKVEFVISSVAENLKAKPDGHQLIFLDKPGHRLAKEGKISENIHSEMKAAIMERTGLSANEVAIISGQEITNPTTGKEAKSGDKDLRKQEIADAYNAGKIKVVIGTTESMGEGMDLQVHTTDIWNIDIPYVPGAFRQRLGRGVRFGNLNKVVKVHYLLMAGTFDNMSLDLVLRKKGWNEAIWDKEVADVISTEEEMTAGSVPQREQIMVELETDPVRKAKLMIQLKGRQLLSDHDTAQSTRMNRDGYVATLERLQLAPLKDTITKRKQDVAEVYAKRQEMKEEAFEKSLAHRQKLLSSAERQLEETHAKIAKAKREVEEAHRMVVAAIARQEEFNSRFSAMVRKHDSDGNPVFMREIVVPPDFDVNAPQYLAGEPPQQTREEDIRFKRAQPEPAGQPLVRAAYLERSVNRLLKRFSGLRKDLVVVAQSESQLPVPLQEQIKKQGMSGGYNAMIWNGKIYLVADNLTGGEKIELAVVEGLLRHEGRHYAIEKIFGNNKARDSFFGQVAEKYSGQVNEYLRSNKLENTPANRIMAAEEVIIDLIRAGETGGIIDRFIARIAELLRQLFPNLKISNAEVRELIARADRIVEGAENITLIGESGKIRASRIDKAPVWFSQLEKTLEAKLPGTGSPQQIKQLVDSWKNKGEFRADELDWVGLNDWLDKKDGKITKQEVLDFVKANNVDVQDVILGGDDPTESDIDTFLADEAGEGFTREEAREYLRNDEDTTKIAKAIREHFKNSISVGDFGLIDRATFNQSVSQYENTGYLNGSLEYLFDENDMTLSDFTGDAKHSDPRLQMEGEKENYREVLLTMPDDIPAFDDFVKKKTAGLSPRQLVGQDELLNKFKAEYKHMYGDGPKQYKSSHFPDTPNILVHVRMNDRTGPNGEKILFLEEVQSDWHQEGRKKGYGKATVPYGWADTGQASSDKVPNAPFKGSKNWAMLAFKRLVRMAAENGYDSISWTPGDVQADRYDLSAQVDEIRYRNTATGDFEIVIFKDGQSIHNDLVKSDNLPNIVGKELAEKMIAKESYDTYQKLSGLDLKVGGEGMKGFYDKILPAEVNKFFNKKMWGGAKVGVVELGALPGDDYHGWNERYPNREGNPYRKPQEVWELKITPEMRQKALREGMPKFLMGGPRLASEKGMADLETAKNMKGTPEEIWKKTGWWKLGDEWKFEISPENAHFDTNKLAGLLLDAVTSIQKGDKKLVPDKPLFEQAKGVKVVAKAPLGEVFHYPGLYDLFPMAQDVNLEIVLDGGYEASFDRSSNTLKLSIGNEMPSEVLTWITKDEIPADKFRSFIEHEVQHLVQSFENFPRGGSVLGMASVDAFLPTRWAAKLQGAIQKAEARADKHFREKTPYGSWLENVEEAKEELRVIKALNAVNGYRLLTGEAEARMTQARLEMTPQQRKAEPPWVSLERLLRKEGLLKEGQELNDVLVDHYYERELVNKYIAFTGTANIWAPEPGFPNGRPRLDMIGTGHGVTAYGWGWYGAQSKKIAEYYRQAGLTPEQRETNKGNVYKLDIPDASKPKMLKWDSTWSEQTPFVRDALTKAGVFEIARKYDEESVKAFKTVIRAKHFDPTGRAVYNALSSLQEGEDSGVKDKAAAEYLRSLGIVGNTYLDFSDKSGQASYDYVLWDQDTIDKIVVLERNEKLLPVPPSEMPEIQRRAQNLWSRAYSNYRAVPFWKRPFVQGLSEAKKSIWHTTGWWQDEKGKWLFAQPPTDTMRLDPKTLPWNRPAEKTEVGGPASEVRFSRKPGPVGEGGTVNPLDSISAMVLEHTEAHTLPGNVALRLIESVTDRLRRSNSKLMIHLADKVDTYYDQVDKRMGWWNGKLKPHLDAIGRKDRKKFYKDYEQFWRDHDNGRPDEAQAVLAQAHPELAKMIDTVMDLLVDTGSANQTVQQQKGRPDPVDYYFYHNGIYKQARAEQAFWRDSLNEDLVGFSEEEKEGITGEAPQYWRAVGEGNEKLASEILDNTPGLKKFIDKVGGKAGVKRVSGMMVYDSTRGGYRPIRTTPRGKFYPRMIQAEVGQVLRDTSYRMGKGKELWSQMVDALIEEGHIIDASEAHRYLSGYFSKEIADDYFAGVEKARQKKLPELFYDYSTNGISMYAYKWANRLSQVEQFGQDMGRGAPDLFDEVTAGFSDTHTKQYVEQIATQVYKKRQYDTLLSAMDAANILATATQLGNPATATLNLLGGTLLNWQLMGAKNMLKAFRDLVFDWKGIQQRSVELGIGGKDLMNILNDTERQAANLFSEETSIKRALSRFANFTMTWGGYRGTENIVRTLGMVGAQYQLQDAIGAHKKNPTGTLAGKYRALMERNGIDYDRVMAEGGAGDETAKYLRKMVNIPQGSYRIDQTPMYVDTRIGRFLFKYQKFGTQVSRMFWMNYLKPFMDAKTGADRFDAFMGLLGFFAKGIAGGSMILATRAALFGYRDPGPDDDDVKKAFENDDFHRGFGLLASRAFHNLMAASALGFFGNYVNFALDVTDQQRPKNPFDPPALGTIKGMQDLVLTYLDQGKLSAGDLDNYLQAQLALYRGYKRAGTSISAEFNSDWKSAQLFEAGKERGYARKAAMQFAKETGVEAKRQQSGMPVKSPMTPINRELYNALVLGDTETARAIVREALKGKNVKERREAVLSMQASARARQPLSIQGRMTQKDRAGFYRWARENLAEENFNRVRNLDKQYRNTMVRAGLAKKTGWIPPEI